MNDKLTYSGLGVNIKAEPCYCNCEYCLAGSKRYVRFPLERYEAIAHRFIVWKETQAPEGFSLWFTPFYSLEISMERLQRYQQLAAQVGREFPGGLQLNGIRIRTEDEMRHWLLERKAAGVKFIHSAFYGDQVLQDKTHGRFGDQNFLIMSNRVAAEIGLRRWERIFLTKSTLPHIENLIDRLDGIANLEKRWIQPLGRYGKARQMEALRCTRGDLEKMSERVSRYLHRDSLFTEGEFMALVRSGYTASNEKSLSLWIDDSNIDEVESKSCDEIICGLKTKYDRLYSLLPDLDELCEKYGDANSDGLSGSDSIVSLWRERYLRDHPQLIAKDEEDDFIYLTHLQ